MLPRQFRRNRVTFANGPVGFDPGSFDRVDPVKAHVRRLWKAHQLTKVRILSSLRQSDLVALMVVRDEAPRLPYLLGYYRDLGVDHFIVIDNGSADGTTDLLLGQPDVSVYHARGSYSRARFGVDWANMVLNRHCVGKWILYVDADEILVYTAADRGGLPAVCRGLEHAGSNSMQTLMVDMYSTDVAAKNVVEVGQDPLEVCNRYDSAGYSEQYDPASGTTWVKGGVRGRLFFPDVWDGPALNKTPLVRWRRHFAFLRSTHILWPRALNGCDPYARPGGALLHFKFTSLATTKILDVETRTQHTTEYDAYEGLRDVDMTSSCTARYRTPADLVDRGLIRPVG